jgi:hypothetical protein
LAEVRPITITSAPGTLIGTRPAVVEALVSSLIESGHPATNIVLWDRDPRDLRTAGFVSLAQRLGVRVAHEHFGGIGEGGGFVIGKIVHG